MSNKPPEFIDGTFLSRHGRESDVSVPDFLRKRAHDVQKPWYWLEPSLQLNPDGSAGRLRDFQPFTQQLPETLPELEMAYLFGTYFDLPMGLHVVASGAGCRWFEFYAYQQEHCQAAAIRERQFDVLTRRDFERFFGTSKPDWCIDRKLYVIEYWKDEGLMTWWLGASE